jgi:nicotinamidase-related amidase
MPSKVWDAFLTHRDKSVLALSGYAAREGFGERPALLVVDVTYGFCGDRPQPILESIKDWPNSCGEAAWHAIGVIGRLLSQAREKQIPVIYTANVRRPDGWDYGSWSWKNSRFGESRPKAFPKPPNEIVAEIAPAPSDIVILKQKPSAFFATPLHSYLTLLRCDSIIIAGTTTSGCVRATVVDAFSNNFRIAVVEDGCVDRAEASHALTLFDMDSKYADVVTSAEAIDYLKGLRTGLFEIPKGMRESR